MQYGEKKKKKKKKKSAYTNRDDTTTRMCLSPARAPDNGDILPELSLSDEVIPVGARESGVVQTLWCYHHVTHS